MAYVHDSSTSPRLLGANGLYDHFRLGNRAVFSFRSRHSQNHYSEIWYQLSTLGAFRKLLSKLKLSMKAMLLLPNSWYILLCKPCKSNTVTVKITMPA